MLLKAILLKLLKWLADHIAAAILTIALGTLIAAWGGIEL